MSFEFVDNNSMINLDAVSSVEMRNFNGENVVVATAGGREFIVKRDIDRFLTLVRNHGKNETFWAGR